MRIRLLVKTVINRSDRRNRPDTNRTTDHAQAVTTAEWANAATGAATGRCRRHQHRFVHRKRCVADRSSHRHTANTARPNYTTARWHGEVVRQKATGHGGRRMVIRYHQSAQRRRHVAA
uniref:Uncharacterized protein n=1 Tax=Anopheles coluzzii TaxID=1518534 RepID=A0A8W7Q367_ANOCL